MDHVTFTVDGDDINCSFDVSARNRGDFVDALREAADQLEAHDEDDSELPGLDDVQDLLADELETPDVLN